MPIIVLVPDSSLSKWDHRTGTLINRNVLFSIDSTAIFPAWDKRFLWITKANNLLQYELGVGAPSLIGTNGIAHTPNAGCWFDGRFIWTLERGGTLRRVDPKTHTVLDSSTLSGNFRGLTGDKRYLWTINLTSGNVEKHDARTATLIDGFTRPTSAVALHHDGRFLWILTGTGNSTGTIKQYDPVTGTQIGTFNITTYTTSAQGPLGIVGDGRFLYVTEFTN